MLQSIKHLKICLYCCSLEEYHTTAHTTHCYRNSLFIESTEHSHLTAFECCSSLWPMLEIGSYYGGRIDDAELRRKVCVLVKVTNYAKIYKYFPKLFLHRFVHRIYIYIYIYIYLPSDNAIWHDDKEMVALLICCEAPAGLYWNLWISCRTS